MRRALPLSADLQLKHQTIFEVALDVGFASDGDFSRSFKKRYGVSPMDARSLGLSELAAEENNNDSLGRRYEQWIRLLPFESLEQEPLKIRSCPKSHQILLPIQ